MESRWIWKLSRIARRIWFRAALFSVLGVFTALLAIIASPFIPDDLSATIGADAVDNILSIIASSMLAVTTFSLSTMVSAYAAATSNVTPRATTLVMEDSTTQNVLSTFIGSFIFSLVGIIALSTGAYGDEGRLVLFLVTIGVVGVIVVTLLRWMDHLSRLGRVTETTERVERATLAAMEARRERPYLGGQPLIDVTANVPSTARPIHFSSIGYTQHLDVSALSSLAHEGGGRIYVRAVPGKLVDPTTPIAWAEGLTQEDQESAIRGCFTIGETRSFDQDPRFGASVLAEIASRALSPAINDPGTAIDVLSRAMRILTVWSTPVEQSDSDGVVYPNVYIPPVELADLFDDLFTPIARDGAAIVEVGLRLQKTLKLLSQLPDRRYVANAERHSSEALERAEIALSLEADRCRLRQVALVQRKT